MLFASCNYIPCDMTKIEIHAIILCIPPNNKKKTKMYMHVCRFNFDFSTQKPTLIIYINIKHLFHRYIFDGRCN